MKKIMCILLAAAILPLCAFSPSRRDREIPEKDYIKWVDFAPSAYAMRACLELDKKLHDGNSGYTFVKGLSYLAIKNGNRFSEKTDRKNVKTLSDRLSGGESMDAILPQGRYADYYTEAFGAVVGEYVGSYEKDGEAGYGLRCYFPLAAGYGYTHYDDFGSSRSFGFKRRHLGHDLMGGIGTPVVAVEGGTVTECGWNRYGGWRIGIRTADTRRYYYYAHLRKGRPFAEGLKCGDTVAAGQVIGYLGMTGYSSKEDTNLKTGSPHLHFGVQLIFDKSQEKGNKEIWIDAYALCTLLSANRAKTVKDENKEHRSVSLMEWK